MPRPPITLNWKSPRVYLYGMGLVIGMVVLSILLHRVIVLDEEPGLHTFAVVHFLGYLFFVISPVELLFINMPHLHEMKSDLIGLAVGTALLAQAIDYAIGYTFSDFVVHQLIGKRRYETYLGRIKRFGDVAIFLFCLLPLSSPILVLVAGMVQYGLMRVLLLSALGLTVKYILLAQFFA